MELSVTEASLLLSGAQATDAIWEKTVALPELAVVFVATLPKVATSCLAATSQMWISALLSARYFPFGDQANPPIFPSKVSLSVKDAMSCPVAVDQICTSPGAAGQLALLIPTAREAPLGDQAIAIGCEFPATLEEVVLTNFPVSIFQNSMR